MKLIHIVCISALCGAFTFGCVSLKHHKAAKKVEHQIGFDAGYAEFEKDCQAMKDSCVKSLGTYQEALKKKNERLRKFNQAHKDKEIEKRARDLKATFSGSGPDGEKEWMK